MHRKVRKHGRKCSQLWGEMDIYFCDRVWNSLCRQIDQAGLELALKACAFINSWCQHLESRTWMCPEYIPSRSFLIPWGFPNFSSFFLLHPGSASYSPQSHQIQQIQQIDACNFFKLFFFFFRSAHYYALETPSFAVSRTSGHLYLLSLLSQFGGCSCNTWRGAVPIWGPETPVHTPPSHSQHVESLAG